MKIICIGKNYAAHAKEMKSEVPAEPVFFMKPDTALLKEKDFYYPDFTQELHHEIEIVLKICKAGKHIEEKFAGKYFEEITLGLDFTARDIQEECRKKGLPWEKAKAFDNSAAVGTFIGKDKLDVSGSVFELRINNELRQKGTPSQMLFGFERVISYVSRFVSLRIGDLVFTGTPEGVGAVKRGDKLEGLLDGNSLLNVNIK
jgi:acylpyruvate hydrolase